MKDLYHVRLIDITDLRRDRFQDAAKAAWDAFNAPRP